MADPSGSPCIYVLAGPNGGGKSSLAGAAFRAAGTDYFNPDEAAARIRSVDSSLTTGDANALAWQEGRRLLERAIAQRCTLAFETTLGGTTITGLLEDALEEGLAVRVWYVALDHADRHVARVRARVARGGHDIPEELIRRRYDRSRIHLIRLLPRLTELRLYDNSDDADPHEGREPCPRLVLHIASGRIVSICTPARVPQWAKPIVMTAMRLPRRHRGGSA